MSSLGYLPFHKKIRMTCLIRNPQCPPCAPILELHLLTDFYSKYIDIKLSRYLPEGQRRSVITLKMTLSFKSMPSKYHHSGPLIPEKLVIKILTQHFQGLSPRVKQDHS